MNLRLVVFAVLLNSFVFASILSADTIHLKNGNTLEGIIEKETPEAVDVNLGFGSATFLKTEIARVDRSTPDRSQQIWNEWDKNKKEKELRRPVEEAERLRRRAEAERLEKEEEKTKKEKEEYGPKEVRVETKNNQFYVQVLINGKIHAKLLLDSGAGHVLFPRRIADELGIDFGMLERSSSRVADGRIVECRLSSVGGLEVLNSDDLKPTGVKLNNVSVAFTERVNDIIQEGEGRIFVPDDGLLGMAFLKYFELKLSLEGKKITFQKIRPQ